MKHSNNNLNLWEWDLSQNKLHDFGCCKALSIFNINEFLTRLHPNDQKTITSKLTNSIKNFEDFNAEFRMKFAKDNYEWIRALGRYIHDSKKKPIKMIGSWYLISEEKNNQALLRLQQQMLVLLTRNSTAEKPYPNPHNDRDRLLTEDELQALKMVWKND